MEAVQKEGPDGHESDRAQGGARGARRGKDGREGVAAAPPAALHAATLRAHLESAAED